MNIKCHTGSLPHPRGALPHVEGGLIDVDDLQLWVIHHFPDNLLAECLLLITDLPLSVLLAVEDDLWPLEGDPQSPVVIVDSLMGE